MCTPEAATRAQLALAVSARDIADHARGMIGDLDARQTTGERIRATRQVRALAMAVLDSAVLVEAVAGADWGELGTALGLSEGEARRRYAENVEIRLDDADGQPLDLAVFSSINETMHPDTAPKASLSPSNIGTSVTSNLGRNPAA